MPGVVRTRVGYSGGTTRNPDYEHIGDHAESVQIEYDPTRISYAELLGLFWRSHDPTTEPYSSQYASIIFYHNEEQKRLAEETKAREEAKRKRMIYTRILPATEFYQAEDYHQKFYLRLQDDLMREFRAMYPDFDDFIRSTAAARVNGYVHGQGTRETLQKEIDSYGLSPAAREKLRELFTSAGP